MPWTPPFGHIRSLPSFVWVWGSAGRPPSRVKTRINARGSQTGILIRFAAFAISSLQDHHIERKDRTGPGAFSNKNMSLDRGAWW